jgi:AcrR family transcriptional regulator
MTRLTRTESRLITRKRIKDAALQEISTYGYTLASVDRIAAAAGYTKGAVYANFSSKQDLLLELLQETNTRITAVWRALLAMPDDMESIYQAMVAQFEAMLKTTDWGLFLAEINLQAKRDKQFAAIYRNYQAEFRQNSNEFLIALFAKVGKRLPIPVDTASSMLQSLGLGICINAETNARDPDVSKNAATMMEVFLKGLIAMADPLPKRTTKRTRTAIQPDTASLP